jgi:hypothetical protein
MSKKKSSLINGVVVFMIFWLMFHSFVTPAFSATTDVSSICIIPPINADEFPQLEVTFRTLGDDNKPIKDLSKKDISIKDHDKENIMLSELKSVIDGTGLNIYFVIDQGNRTNQEHVKAILTRFAEKYMIDKVDRVTILTNFVTKNKSIPHVLVNPTNTRATFLDAVANLPSVGNNEYIPINTPLEEAFRLIREDNFGCTYSSLVIAITGPDEIYGSTGELVQSSNYLNAPVHIIHLKKYGIFSGQEEYEFLASNTGGIYEQVDMDKSGDGIRLDRNLFDPMSDLRLAYTAVFRTTSDYDGIHLLSLLIENQRKTLVSASHEYKVSVQDPMIEFSEIDGDIDTNNPFTVEFMVKWPDNHPRNIAQANISLGNTVFELSKNMSHTFDSATLKKIGGGKTILKVEIEDEFGRKAFRQGSVILIDPANVPTNAGSGVIASVPPDSTPSLANHPVIYILISLIMVLAISIFLLRRQISKLTTGGVIGKAVDDIVKTFIPGSKPKGGELGFLRVLDGPSSLLNKEIKIITESVKLGRDPKRADITFFGPQTASSISGLHAKLERVNNHWRLIAISHSGSETFLDDVPIEFHVPIQIHSGQRIRLGYLGQESVELMFVTSGPGSTTDQDNISPLKTQIRKVFGKDQKVMKISKNKSVASDNTEPGTNDNLFEKFR